MKYTKSTKERQGKLHDAVSQPFDLEIGALLFPRFFFVVFVVFVLLVVVYSVPHLKSRGGSLTYPHRISRRHGLLSSETAPLSKPSIMALFPY